MPATWASTPGTFCTVAESTCLIRQKLRIEGNHDNIVRDSQPQRAVSDKDNPLHKRVRQNSRRWPVVGSSGRKAARLRRGWSSA
jgi:hypothetical protein